VKARFGNEEALEVQYSSGMNFYKLKERIVAKREYLGFPAAGVSAIHSSGFVRIKPDEQVPAPVQNSNGSKKEISYYFTLAEFQPSK